jgi:AcrR family transcriptional regulator
LNGTGDAVRKAKENRDSGEPNKREAAIARAGAELFSSKGFIETTMEDVARAARISKGGMYHYFASKTDLLYFILDGFMDAVLQDLEPGLASMEGNLDRIRYIIFRHVDNYTKQPYAAKALLDEEHSLPAKYSKKIMEKERKYLDILRGVLSAHLGESVGKDRLTAITFNLLGMCNWIYSWYDPKGSISPEQLAQMIFEMFTGGVGSLGGNGAARNTGNEAKHRSN